jgi:hypothetical protein
MCAARPELRWFREFAHVGDPLADTLADEIRSLPDGVGRRQFNLALRHGLDGMDDAGPALRAFIADIESVPGWLDRDRLELASRTMRRTGGWSTHAVLVDVSLMGGYVASRAAKVLMRTGHLHSKAERRLGRTAAWWMRVTEAGGLERFALGFLEVARVRVMHAEVRAAMRRRVDWNECAWDLPLNQCQCAGTVLLFSVVYLAALRALGFRFTHKEREAVIHFWRYVGMLMGVDPSLLAADEAGAWRLLELQAQTEFLPDQDSRRLARAASAALPAIHGVNADGRARRLAARMIIGYHTALSRLLLGASTADALGLPRRRAYTPAVLATSAANLAIESGRQLLPGATALRVRLGDRSRRRHLERLNRTLSNGAAANGCPTLTTSTAPSKGSP